MSGPQQNPVDQTRLAIAALTACIAQTLNESDESFVQRFSENLDKMYRPIRDVELDHKDGLETLSWTMDLLNK